MSDSFNPQALSDYELIDVHRNIDEEQYPERKRAAFEEIERRRVLNPDFGRNPALNPSFGPIDKGCSHIFQS